ncbi:MAG: acyl-coenzyme A synthetase/AMP-(fatty) acid ligase [Pseudoalteromonas distincta]|jgi:acyl-coenzyme A synthetase/AMP-(fatty) acid ligase
MIQPKRYRRHWVEFSILAMALFSAGAWISHRYALPEWANGITFSVVGVAIYGAATLLFRPRRRRPQRKA